MNNYEILYIIKNSIEDDAKDAAIAKINGLVESLGGSIVSEEKWGTKKFAYLLDDMTEGYYVLLNATAPATFPEEVQRLRKITDNIVRVMVIAK